MGSRLKIINAMLRIDGEFARDTELDTHPDVAFCSAILDDTTEEVLGRGWWFNERIVTLNVNGAGEILVPEGTLTLDATDSSIEVSILDGKLYDNINQTFQFSNPVEAIIIYNLPEESLPPVMYHYIKWLAVIEYAGISQITGEIVQTAQVKFVQAESNLSTERYRKADTNFNNNPMAQRINAFRVKFSTTRKRGYSGSGYSRVQKRSIT